MEGIIVIILEDGTTIVIHCGNGRAEKTAKK